MNELQQKQRLKEAERIATEIDKRAGGYFRKMLIQAALKGIECGANQNVK